MTKANICVAHGPSDAVVCTWCEGRLAWRDVAVLLRTVPGGDFDTLCPTCAYQIVNLVLILRDAIQKISLGN